MCSEYYPSTWLFAKVDIVLDAMTALWPIEVKYRNDALKNTEGLYAFTEKFQSKKRAVPLMVTKNDFSIGEKLNAIPFIYLK